MSDRKRCFLVAPIGEPGSDTHKRSNVVLKYILRPPVENCGYELIRADDISSPGMVTIQVLNHLAQDDLVIADLTGQNPNVYYEVGIRHSNGKPIIHIIEAKEHIPFDVAAFRTIVVDHRDLDRVEQAKNQITSAVEAVEMDPSSFQGLVQFAEQVRVDKTEREIPINAYIADEDPKKAKQMVKALDLFKQALDLVRSEEGPAESGSWFKHWIYRTREAMSEPEVAERLRKAERALEMQVLHKIQAEVDQKQAEAAAALIEALKDSQAAAIQVGSLLLVKTTSPAGPLVAARTLTQNEMLLLEKNPSLLRNPEDILFLLSKAQEASLPLSKEATVSATIGPKIGNSITVKVLPMSIGDVIIQTTDSDQEHPSDSIEQSHVDDASLGEVSRE